MIFHSFSSSLSIRDELVESSSDSCNILPETVTVNATNFPVLDLQYSLFRTVINYWHVDTRVVLLFLAPPFLYG
jgi:hypothetical protein